MTISTRSKTLTTQVDELLQDYDTENEQLVELARLVDYASVEAVAAFVENYGAHYYPLDRAGDWAHSFCDSYIGYTTAREYAEELVDEGAFGDIPESLTYYIDYDAIAADLLQGDYWESEDGHLFRSF